MRENLEIWNPEYRSTRASPGDFSRCRLMMQKRPATTMSDGDQEDQRRGAYGNPHNVLIHRWPIRSRGTIPAWGGIQ